MFFSFSLILIAKEAAQGQEIIKKTPKPLLLYNNRMRWPTECSFRVGVIEVMGVEG